MALSLNIEYDVFKKTWHCILHYVFIGRHKAYFSKRANFSRGGAKEKKNWCFLRKNSYFWKNAFILRILKIQGGSKCPLASPCGRPCPPPPQRTALINQRVKDELKLQEKERAMFGIINRKISIEIGGKADDLTCGADNATKSSASNRSSANYPGLRSVLNIELVQQRNESFVEK